MVEDEDNYCYVAYIDTIPVGYLWAQIKERPENPFKYSQTLIYVHHIAVHENYRRHHVGKILMNKVEDLAQTHGIASIALDVWAFNTTAQKFFENMGFSVYNLNLWRK